MNKKFTAIFMIVAVLLSGCGNTRHIDGITSSNSRSGEANVAMSEQEGEFVFKCTHLINETHAPSISVKASYRPNMAAWQGNVDLLHRLTAVYGNPQPQVAGNDPNVVSIDDVKTAVNRVLAKYHESLCAAAKAKSLPDLLSDPGLYQADELNKKLADKDRHFDITVSMTKVLLPDDLLRALALKGLKAAVVPPAPAKVVPKAKITPQAPSNAQPQACIPLCQAHP